MRAGVLEPGEAREDCRGTDERLSFRCCETRRDSWCVLLGGLLVGVLLMLLLLMLVLMVLTLVSLNVLVLVLVLVYLIAYVGVPY